MSFKVHIYQWVHVVRYSICISISTSDGVTIQSSVCCLSGSSKPIFNLSLIFPDASCLSLSHYLECLFLSLCECQCLVFIDALYSPIDVPWVNSDYFGVSVLTLFKPSIAALKGCLLFRIISGIVININDQTSKPETFTDFTIFMAFQLNNAPKMKPDMSMFVDVCD